MDEMMTAEANRARVLKWQRENPEKVKAKMARTRAKRSTRERESRNAHAWKTSPRGRILTRRSKHLRRSAPGSYTVEQLQARIDLYGRRCYLCGCDWDALVPKEKHIEHVIPLSRGGTNWPANLRPACGRCNRIKGVH
jgi:5-methylcytosine-specific restriction endonuclease McrA